MNSLLEVLGALAISVVLYLVFCIAKREIFRSEPRLCILAVIVGGAIGVGLIYLPDGFAAAVARTLGGISLTAFIVLGIEIYNKQDEIKDLEAKAIARSRSLLGWIFEAAKQKPNPHEYIKQLLASEVIYPEEARSLHGDIYMITGIAPP